MPARHRDDRRGGRRPPPSARESPWPSRAEHQGDLVEAGDGLLDGDGVVGQRQRHRGEARARDSDGSASYQSGEPGPRQREHRAHRDLDRAAVERVGAPRRQQHGVEAERGAASGRSRRRWCGRRCPRAPAPTGRRRAPRPRDGQRPPLQRGQRAAVHVEAGHLLGQRLATRRSRARRVVASTSASPSSQRGAIRNERGAKPASTARRTTFSPSARNSPCSASRCLRSCDVAQVAVVGQPRVGRVGRSRRARPCSADVALGVGHRDDVADHDDRRRPRPRSRVEVGSPSVPSVDEHGPLPGHACRRRRPRPGCPASRPPASSASAMAGAFSTAIISTQGAASAGRRRPSRPASRGARAAGARRSTVKSWATPRWVTGMPARAGHGDRAGQPGHHRDRYAGLAAGQRPPRSRGRRRSCRRP